MIQTTEIKKKSKGCTLTIEAPRYANFLSVQAQIMLKCNPAAMTRAAPATKPKTGERTCKPKGLLFHYSSCTK